MPTLIAILRQIGLIGTIIIAILVFYEGIPVLRENPWTLQVPILRDLVHGRVRAESERAVSEALKAMNELLERKTVEAQLAELERQRLIRQISEARFDLEVEKATREEAEASAQLEKERQQNEERLRLEKRSCILTDDDIEWMRR